MVAAGLRRAVMWVRPWHTRGQRATATLQTLRQASERLDERLDAESEGLTKLEGKSEIRLPTPHVQPERTKLDSEGIRSVLGSMLGRTSTKTEQPAAEDVDEEQPTPASESAEPDKKSSDANDPDDDDESGGMTSSLLAARRRARRRLRGGDDL